MLFLSDDFLERGHEDGSDFYIDERADSLDTTSFGESYDGWLADTYDVSFN